MSKPAPRTGRKISARMARKRAKARLGLETGPEGADIGRDPRRLSPAELRSLGHRAAPLLQSMRRRCVDCCGGKTDEVRRCTAVACPLWPYRMGADPWEAAGARPATPKPRPEGAATASQPAPSAAPVPAGAERAPAAVDQPPAKRRRPERPCAAPSLPLFDDAGAT